MVESEFLTIVRNLAIHETIHLLVSNEEMERSVKLSLKNEGVKMENIIFHDIPTNDSWIRDYGPNFIVQDKNGKRKVAANDWNFDSWGRKYKWELDDLAGTIILKESGLQCFKPCLLYTSPSPRDGLLSRMPSSA